MGNSPAGAGQGNRFLVDARNPAARWPRPFEGITGTHRAGDLLSLEDAAMPRRRMMIMMGLCLQAAVTVGSPAPVVRRIASRMNDPQPGDLVFEASNAWRRGSELRGLGILLAHRDEWLDSDADWETPVAGQPGESPCEDDRPSGHFWYIQYGPGPQDVRRWHDCMFLALPASDEDAIAAFGSGARLAPGKQEQRECQPGPLHGQGDRQHNGST